MVSAFLAWVPLLLLLLWPRIGCSQQRTDVQVGVLFELGQNSNAPARLLALHLALDCMNTGSTAYCPACETLRDSPVRLHLHPADAGTSKTTAENKAIELWRTIANLSGLIGPLSSTNSDGVAAVLGPYSMSLISPSATRASLDEKTNFFRTTPSDTVVCAAIMELVVHLKYSNFVGLMEATTGGMSDGINRRMQQLALDYGVAYQPVYFDGLTVESAMEQLKNLNPEVILAVGDSTQTTFNIFKSLHQYRARGQLAYRVLLGGDYVAGGNAPRKGNNAEYFEGVVSFKSSGSGERYEKFEQDWPTLIDGLDKDSILNVGGKQYNLAPEHLQKPPSYVTESFEAAILFAKAMEIVLEKDHKVNLGEAMVLLQEKEDWFCLDRDPVKLEGRTRKRSRVSMFRHTLPDEFTPSVIGQWTPEASLQITGELGDLMNPALPSQTAKSEGDDLPDWVYGVIASLSAVLFFACVALVVCYRCQKCLPRRFRRDPEPVLPGPGPSPVPPPAPVPSPRPQPHVPTRKYPGYRSIAILGGGPEALLHAIVEGHMALTKTEEKPTQVRLYTNKVRRGSGGVEHSQVERERPWNVEVLHDHALELLARIYPTWTPAGSEPCWSVGDSVWTETRNVVDTDVEDELLALLNRMLDEQNRRAHVEGQSVLKFRLEIEELPTFQEQRLWEKFYLQFLGTDIADAVVVTGEACCLGLIGDDRPQPAEGSGLQSAHYALRIAVHPDEGHQQRQKHNAFVSLCNCRVAYTYNSQKRKGTLVLRITEAERNSLRLTANSGGELLGSRFSLIDHVWPTTSDRSLTSFDGLQSELGIVSSYIREVLPLFNVLPEFVQRIECVKLVPAAMPKQAFLKGPERTPVVLLGRSAYITDIQGRGLSCHIKGAFMSAIALRLFLFSKDQKALEKLEAFLKLDRNEEMKFASSMKGGLPEYLDEVVNAGGEDRFRSQLRALRAEMGVTDLPPEQREAFQTEIVKDLAERSRQWQRHTRWDGEQNIHTELTSFEGQFDSPLKRRGVTLEVLYALQQISIETKPPSGKVSGVRGLPMTILWGAGAAIAPGSPGAKMHTET